MNRALFFGSTLLLGIIGLFAFVSDGHIDHGPVICLFKRLTGIPCPTCGVTRSAVAILHGDIIRGILINPLGLLLLIFTFITMIWSAIDMNRKDQSLFRTYKLAERVILKWYVLLPIVILNLLNWNWNIIKGL